MLNLIFILLVSLFWWCYILYPIYLDLYKKRKHKKKIIEWPEVTMIIPFYNEEKLIADKIDNTVLLDYPRDKLKVILADGNSTDRTCEIIAEHLPYHMQFRLERTNIKGKINQLNRAMKLVKTEIIVHTDVDAMLEPNVIKKLVAELSIDKVGVAGAYVIPETDSIEKDYWEIQNKLRVMESRYYSSSIVAAPCYAYKKELLTKFPYDVIADDIYISFKAIDNGYIIKYVEDAVVSEIRVPKTFEGRYKQKSRRANAYFKELFRFAGDFLSSPLEWFPIFYTKILQMVVLPLLFPFMIIFSTYMLFTAPVHLLIAGVMTGVMFTLSSPSRYGKGSLRNFFTKVRILMFSMFVLLTELIRYPFRKQDSRYEKV